MSAVGARTGPGASWVRTAAAATTVLTNFGCILFSFPGPRILWDRGAASSLKQAHLLRGDQANVGLRLWVPPGLSHHQCRRTPTSRLCSGCYRLIQGQAL